MKHPGPASFAERQVAPAEIALLLAEVGAACAALRTLEPGDFGGDVEAAHLLQAISDGGRGLDDRARVVEQLVSLHVGRRARAAADAGVSERVPGYASARR